MIPKPIKSQANKINRVLIVFDYKDCSVKVLVSGGHDVYLLSPKGGSGKRAKSALDHRLGYTDWAEWDDEGRLTKVINKDVIEFGFINIPDAQRLEVGYSIELGRDGSIHVLSDALDEPVLLVNGTMLPILSCSKGSLDKLEAAGIDVKWGQWNGYDGSFIGFSPGCDIPVGTSVTPKAKPLRTGCLALKVKDHGTLALDFLESEDAERSECCLLSSEEGSARDTKCYLKRRGYDTSWGHWGIDGVLIGIRGVSSLTDQR